MFLTREDDILVITKIINNNVVSTIDEKGRELILMGCGLGFQKKPGDEVDESKMEKRFRLDSIQDTRHFADIVEDMPIEHLRISSKIISYAKEKLEVKFSRSIYITLTDHINFAIERHSRNIDFSNPLTWEIKRIYKSEFEIGMKALEMIKESLGIELPEDEGASIAMHFVNAESERPDMAETIKTTKLIQNAMNIVRFHFNIELDTDSIQYSRFVTHLRFFAQRILSGSTISNNDDTLFQTMAKAYPDDLKCAEKIGKYIYGDFGYNISDEEKTYLLVHINRIRNR